MIWADNTRIIAIFFVILIHVTAGFVYYEPGLGSASWWIANMYDSSSRWSVPVFVMLSGALLLDDKKIETWKQFYRKRAQRLLVPIIFWSLFYILWTCIQAAMNKTPIVSMPLIKSLLIGKPYYHMWFLYMIAGLYAITPYLRTLTRGMDKKALFVFTIAGLLVAALKQVFDSLYGHNSYLFFVQFISYVPYFLLGYFIRTSRWNPKPLTASAVFASSVCATALGCYLLSETYAIKIGLYFYEYLSITVIPMSISMFFLLKRTAAPVSGLLKMNNLSQLVLGIYVMHPFLLDLLRLANIEAKNFNSLYSIPLVTLFVFMVSAVMSSIFQKSRLLRLII